LHGFEILMASYAVAHLKLDMLLGETGYHHNSDKRHQVYLTNSLEESNNEPRTLFAQWLSLEATEANVIKRDCPVMVVIGNPPYSGESQNKGKWIMSLMEDYKKEPGSKTPLNERNPKWLNDDYVKFIRLAQHYIEKKGEGIIGFINPHGYLDNPTFRGMRWSLLKTFDIIYTIDLHGNSKKKETCPDGSKDENVFDIMQGVSINLFVKTGRKDKDELGKVYHKDLYGLRQQKYDFLDGATLENVGYEEMKPMAPMYFFVPKNFDLQEEYDKGFKVDELFNVSSVSVVTAKDAILVDMNENNLFAKVKQEYGSADSSLIKRYNYRPFDDRFVYYDVQKIERPRETTMRQMVHQNIALLTCRQLAGNEWKHVSVADGIVDDCRVSSKTKERGYVFPLYVYKENMGKEECIVNFNTEMYEKIAKGLNYYACAESNVLIDPISDYNGVLYPQDLFDYIYAVLHSPSYRERYKEFLKIDFPRIPCPTDWEKFRDLVELGEELRQLHLMEDLPSKTGITFPVAGSLQVDCYRWQDKRVYINAEQYFDGVPVSAWNFFIGGYQPAQKWLKDRKGMTLSFEDVKHYGHIIYVLQQTEKIMGEIDDVMSNKEMKK
jgi:predicted helicase